jgi:hypothetical protein
MTVTSNSEFAKRMMLLAHPAERYQATATYDRDGDCIEFLAKPDPFFADRVDDLVTVYYSQETGEVVGSLIKGVSRCYREILTQLPGFQIEIHDGPISLQHFFLARMWSSVRDPEDLATLTYRKLVEVSRDALVEGELCMTT